MSNKENLLKEITSFLNEVASVNSSQVELKTEIEMDLGISGDDAEDLINSFAQKFNVNTESFNFSKYFYREPSFFSMQNEAEKESFTVRNLIEAIEKGELY